MTRGRHLTLSAVLMGFFEATVVLAPMEPLFLPMMLSQQTGRQSRPWTVAAFLLAGNVVGALCLYLLGIWLAEPVILPLIEALGMTKGYEKAVTRLTSDGFLALFLVATTPFPFQAGVAAAGVVGYSLFLFTAAITLGRGLRYFGLAALVVVLGHRASDFLERFETHIFISGLLIFAALMAYFLLT